jgi:hypothetical protein
MSRNLLAYSVLSICLQLCSMLEGDCRLESEQPISTTYNNAQDKDFDTTLSYGDFLRHCWASFPQHLNSALGTHYATIQEHMKCPIFTLCRSHARVW